MSAKNVRQFIQQIVGDMWNLPLTAKVMQVDGETCSIKLPSGLELDRVRLKATQTEKEQKIMLTPRIGSDVLVFSQSGDLNNLFVIQINEVEKIEILNDDLQLVLDDQLHIEVSGVNLGQTLEQLCETLKTLTVSTGVGPSGTPLPPTQQKVAQLEQNFKTIFK
ncbi:hypothetical protein [Myroides odoratus]|uniref:Uncharacterized protein n=1 Tax=Myroides odoratus TaxID=256 RepID=A0A378U6S8_MYROD|nr:hypothetical protein [Myroides odoratus]QQU02605.1 hypothetical protein I6I89_12300 [Myroides odoratus]STZ70180.1 Uncharacterised protein [Myroides odoratus]